MNKRLSMDKGAWQARFGPTRAGRDYKAWRTIPIDSPKSMKLKAFPKAPAGLRPSGVGRRAGFAGPHPRAEPGAPLRQAAFLLRSRIPFVEKCAKHGFLTHA